MSLRKEISITLVSMSCMVYILLYIINIFGPILSSYVNCNKRHNFDLLIPAAKSIGCWLKDEDV